MRSIRHVALLAALALPFGVAAAQPELGQGPPNEGPPNEGQPNPAYRDGTGNDQIERLNNGQLDRNYRGPWYEPNGQPAPPPGAMPPYAPGPPGSLGSGAYPPPAYPPPAYPPPDDRPSTYPPPAYPQGVHPPSRPPAAGD